ncbi:MAG: nucleotidyltransferase domain-containing protein [Deltaproteobacteria bacterium]|nr:nucleotidyltransferase domain-containing protein [Deltaproteobacteria bacterium]
MTTIWGILGEYPEIKTVVVFGSRAKGTYKSGSDIDLVIMDSGVDDSVLCKLNNDFSDSCLPYFVDLIYYPTLENSALKEHIDRVGVSF